MIVRQEVYDVDDLWEIVCQSENSDKHFELVNGELFEMAPAGEVHGWIAGVLFSHILFFDPNGRLGIPTVETGYYTPGNRSTVLAPDVAFRRTDRQEPPLSKTFVPVMPDLAVEIVSPSNTMPQIRRKAGIYLRHGAQLVWIVIPDRRGVEVCTLDEDGEMRVEFIGVGGSLSGEDVLPGFRLQLARLFS